MGSEQRRHPLSDPRGARSPGGDAHLTGDERQPQRGDAVGGTRGAPPRAAAVTSMCRVAATTLERAESEVERHGLRRAPRALDGRLAHATSVPRHLDCCASPSRIARRSPVPKSSSRKNDTRKANRDRRQRLDELRRQQRAAERRKNFIFTGSAIFIALALIAGAVIPTYLHDRSKKRKAAEALKKQRQVIQLAPTAAEKAAGCLGVHQDPLSAAAEHVTTAVDYSTEKNGDTAGGTPPIPPSGGKHNPISLGDKTRFYPLADKPRPERAVHNLEHGYVVAWYDAKLPAADVKTLQTLATTLPRFLVVGWSAGDLPADKHLVLTSWGRSDRCATASADVIRSFYSKNVDASRAPEKGFPPITGADTIPASVLPGPNASASPSASASPAPTSTKK